MKPFVISLLAITVLAGLAFADDNKQAVATGTDDMSRYVAARATPGGQTTLRDASGRTVGTASTVGTPTTFRDGSGRTTGSHHYGQRDGLSRCVGANVGYGDDFTQPDHHLS